MQKFVNQSPWDHDAVMFRLRALMRGRATQGGVLVLDHTSLPKQGRHSVGVARQYCGALGKIANCQSVVTWQWVGPRVHWPLAARLYLPTEWTEDPARMARAGVPPDAQAFKEKWRIALDLLDEMKPQLPAPASRARRRVQTPISALVPAFSRAVVRRLPSSRNP